MLTSLMLCAGLILLFFPLCFGGDKEKQQLFERIEVEQQIRFKHAFESQLRRMPPGVKWLRTNLQRTSSLADMLGIDHKKIEACLIRLRWKVSLEEIVLAKLAAVGCMILTTLYLLYKVIITVEISNFDMLLLVICLLLFLLPTWIIEQADKRAKQEIELEIPVFFNIVQALVEAGMPVYQAVQATAKHFQGRLGREFLQLQLDEKGTGNWRKALEEMAYRWDIDALIAMISEINEALTKGTSIAELIAEQVEDQMKQQEDAAFAYMNRLSIRLLPLIIIFMGVPLMYLVMGPSFIGIQQKF